MLLEMEVLRKLMSYDAIEIMIIARSGQKGQHQSY